MTSSNLVLWQVSNTASFFLVPADLALPPGPTALKDFDGNTVSTDLNFLASYAVTFHKAQEFLEAKWKDAVEQSKKAWNNLNQISQITGKTYNMDELKNSLLDAFSSAESSMKDIFHQSQQAVENLMQSVQGSDPKSTEEQKTVIKRIFELFPGLGNAIDEKELDEAVKDPDTWAKKLEEQFLPKEKQEELKRSQEKLTKDIQESIASALRKAGITPSADFDTNKGPQNPQ
ncbi:MAG: hypothetical protein J7578_17365 [Chitinophagaceae bacterium]|nr:hypothetical protein [Chitinophagaceae bacterium]